MRPSRLAPAATFAALAAVAGTAPHPTHAQVAPGDTGTSAAPIPPWERRAATRLALGGAGLYQSWGRPAQQAAVGFDVFGSVAVSAFALGVGYQRSEHRVSSGAAGRVHATYQGVFVEPRVSVAPFRNFAPYLVGRVGWLTQEVPARADAFGAPVAAQSDRVTSLGGGLGALVSVAPNVQLDLTAMYSDVQAGTRPAGSAALGGGRGATLRAGVVLGLEGWGR